MKSNLDQLREGILLALFRQQNKEPQVYAVGGLSPESSRLSKVREYAEDVLRIRNELVLCLSLIQELPGDDFLKRHNTDAIAYILFHQGAALDLTHQMKDKIAHLCDGFTTSGGYSERKEIKIKKLCESEAFRQIDGLAKELAKWTEESKSGIALALKKRTHYHHFRNGLSLNQNLSHAKFAKVLENPQFAGTLTESGKTIIRDRGRQGMADWHTDTIRKLSATVKEVSDSVENISGCLLKAIILPTVLGEGPKILSEHSKMLESLNIKNTAAKELIQAPFIPLVTLFEDSINMMLGDSLAALYLIGSIGRGDAVPGLSDLNFVVVVKSEDSILVEGVRRAYDQIIQQTGLPLDLQIFSLEIFNSPQSTKVRFLCKSEGLLLGGQKIVRDEEFPQPGLRLARLLNSDAKERAESLDQELMKVSAEDCRGIRGMSVAAAKLVLRLVFSAIMSETANYEKSWEKIKDAINKRYPEKMDTFNKMYAVVRGRSVFDKGSVHEIFESIYKSGGHFNLLSALEAENVKLDEIEKKRH